MARVAGIFTVIFLLFTLSHARFLTIDTEHDAAHEETIVNLPESNSKSASADILLPSDNSDVEPAKVADSDSGMETVPLTRIQFHPVNRHFDRRPSIPLFRKHNCRFHKRFRPFKPMFHQKPRAIPYGNDMILSDDTARVDPETRGVVRQIQARWVRFPDDRAESNEVVDFIKARHHDHDHEHDDDEEHHHHHHHHHHHRRHHGEEEEEKYEREEDEHEHRSGFLKSFRKFLTHF